MNTSRFIGFDIETKPLPEMVGRFAEEYPQFDETAVKYGNTRDPVKRAELLTQKRADHELGCAQYWANLKEKAALDPFFGAIVCIGTITEQGEPEIISCKSEEATLYMFWKLYSDHANATTKFVNWSGSGDPYKNFDMDYIVTRSRILHVDVPAGVRRGRYYSERIVDMATEFLLGQRDKYLSMTKCADMLGLYDVPGSKLTKKTDKDVVQGKNFWQFWEGCADSTLTQEQQSLLAQEYQHQDTLHLQAIAPIVLGLR